MAGEITKAISKGLTTYFKANMPGLASAISDFPAPNEELVFPCLSVYLGKPQFMGLAPYVIAKGAVVNNIAPVTKVNGMYDFRIQIDLWCNSKPQRHKMHEEFVDALNKDLNVTGLRLKLTDYFDEWVQFDLSSFDFMDNEDGSERDEWRIKYEILANCKSITMGDQKIITTIENNLATPEEISAEAEDALVLII